MLDRPLARVYWPVTLAIAIAVVLVSVAAIAVRADEPGNRAFQRTWERTDRAVAEGQATRTWIWGPEATGPLLLEDYDEAPDGERVVQYYDKSRMEITDPDGDQTTIWYVTNGLLVVELVTGNMQIGDNHFDDRDPASVNVAGDPDDPEGPTYATFSGLLDTTVETAEAAIDRTVDRDGAVSQDARFGAYGVGTTVWVPETEHWIADPFWAFMNSSGDVWENGSYTTAPLFPNPYYATGFPITDAYWATIVVAGTPRDVLMQCFERRCLTYTPGNPAGFETEAGNVGQHYYRWRYADSNPIIAPTPTPDIPPEGTWRQLQPVGERPSARADHSLVADATGHHIYLFGGRQGGAILNDLWSYDVAANTWSRIDGNGPQPRFGHNAAFDTVTNRVIIFGGQGEVGFFSDVWTWDIANGWTQLENNNAGPLDRYGAGGAWHPATNELYISHGFTSAGRYDDTWTFDLHGDTWQDRSPVSGPRPEQRCLLRTVIDANGNRMLLFGGQSNTAAFLGDLWSFDLATREWRQITTPGPAARNLYSAVGRTDADQMILFGGNAGGANQNDVWMFAFATDTWTEVATTNSPPARNSHDAVWLPGSKVMLLFGGNAGGELGDLWELRT